MRQLSAINIPREAPIRAHYAVVGGLHTPNPGKNRPPTRICVRSTARHVITGSTGIWRGTPSLMSLDLHASTPGIRAGLLLSVSLPGAQMEGRRLWASAISLNFEGAGGCVLTLERARLRYGKSANLSSPFTAAFERRIWAGADA